MCWQPCYTLCTGKEGTSMPRRRTRQTVRLQGWTTPVNMLLTGGLVLACLLVWIALEYPWLLVALAVGIVLCAGGAGFWLVQRRRHLEQLQAYQAQQIEAAQQQQQWEAYHQHQRISQQRELLEA